MKKIISFLKTRKAKVVIVLLLAFLLVNVVEIIVSSQIKSRNDEWGLKVTTSNVSPTGLTMTIERGESEKSEEFMTGQAYWLERRTLFGWKSLEPVDGHGPAFLAVAYGIKEGESRDFRRNWEHAFGRLRPGVYRICTEDRVGQIMTEQPVLYATFVVLF